MKNPGKMAQELKELKSKIERLERAERELTALNAPGEVFASELNSIRARLKLPGKVEEVEQEVKALRQRAEEYSRDLKSRRERLERAERELTALKAPEEVFASELGSLRARLKLPGKVEEVEQEIKALRRRVEEYNRARVPGIQSYSIVEKIGSGGFAEVFLARRKDDGMVVALKVPRLDPVTTFNPADFSREAELWSQLRHPCIVKVYEYGMRPGPWIAMEYMARGSLRERLSKLTLTASLEIGIKVAEALFYASYLGVIHRYMRWSAGNCPVEGKWGEY